MGPRDARRGVRGGGSGHFDFHQLRGPLAVARDGLGQRFHNLRDALLDGPHSLAVRTHSGGSVGQQRQRVVGGGVSVHREAVVAALDAPLEHGAQLRRGDFGVGHHEAQRGRHIRVDHAGPLGHAGHAHRAPPQRDLHGGGLGDQVRGHDGARGVLETVRAQAVNQARQRVHDLAAVHLHADDPRGGRQHLRRPQREQLRGRLARGQRHAVARARGAVGVPGVHQDGAHGALGQRQMAPRQLERSRLHAVLREYGGRIGGQSADDQRQIVLFHLTDSGVDG